MSSLEFEINLKPQGQGLLWALWRIHTLKASGLLTVEWEKFKKQIVFRAGDPIASRSNWPQESLGQYLLKASKLDQQLLRQELIASQADPKKSPLGEWLVSRGLIQPQEMNELLEGHFKERVFSLIGLSHGKAHFQTSSDISLKETDQIKLSDHFLRLLWQAVKQHFEAGVCRSKLSQILSRQVRARGEFPLPLSPQELRIWNELVKDFKLVSSLDEVRLRLTAAASEFELLEVGEGPLGKLKSELEQMDARMKNQKLHEILNIDLETSSLEDIKKSYLDFVKKFHPDRLPSEAPADLKKLSEKVFSRINEAHSVLTDSEKRIEYMAQMELDASGGVEQVEAQLRAEMLLPQAKMALKRRHFKQAQEQYSEIVKILKSDAEVMADLAYAEMMLAAESKAGVKDRLREFMQRFEESMKIRNNYAGAFYYSGLALKMDGRFDKALEFFDRAAQMDPHLTEAASEARVLRMKKDGAKKSGGKS